VAIFLLTPDQTIAQIWSNAMAYLECARGARRFGDGGSRGKARVGVSDEIHPKAEAFCL